MGLIRLLLKLAGVAYTAKRYSSSKPGRAGLSFFRSQAYKTLNTPATQAAIKKVAGKSYEQLGKWARKL